MIKLYQFSLSHYCEKVRWALEYKGVPYQKVNLIPGPHVLKIKKLSTHTTVPVLTDGKRVLQDSTEILNYLEEKYPEPRLNPSRESQKKEALELEEYFDRELGPHLRRYFYYYLLENRALVTGLLLQGTPAWGKFFYTFTFPLIKKIMKKGMRISEVGAQKSLKKLEEVFCLLNKKLEQDEYLVGNEFTRADLSAASLLSPLCQPAEHDFQWVDIDRMPTPLKEFRKKYQYQPFFDWTLRIYKNHRMRVLN